MNGHTNNRIDREQVKVMFIIGINQVNIAHRLDCSRKQVGLILKDADIKRGRSIDSMLNSDYEYALWSLHYDHLRSYERVAWTFGVTRQSVFTQLTTGDLSQ